MKERTANEAVKGIVFNIEHFHIHDGSGIRTLVFLKGCHLRCPWCCNPESQDMKTQIAVYKNLCKLCLVCENACPQKAIYHKDGSLFLNRDLCNSCGECVKKCPHKAREMFGKVMTVEEVMDEVKKDASFYQRSGGGVTLSGGEATLQPEFARGILEACKKEYFNTAVETCGTIKWEYLWMAVEYADEILFDIKYTDPDTFKKISSVPLSVVKENARKLKERGKEVAFRCPIIPDCNDDNTHISNVISWAKELNIGRVDILPFHQLGKHKYASLGLEYELGENKPPEDGRISEIEKMIADAGLKVTIGG